MRNRPPRPLSERRWLTCAVFGGAFAGVLLLGTLTLLTDAPLSSLPLSLGRSWVDAPATTPQLQAILHYATSTVVPQQSAAEIRVSFEVLRPRAPCNFLVFGLGYDSLMWAALNPRGNTLFLEEDPKWVRRVLRRAPSLRAAAVRYPTRLDQADELLRAARSGPECRLPLRVGLPESRCRLALTALPQEVYETEWDLIMIDAPRGYFDAAPGRMGAIFTAAAMARGRRRREGTHVFLHDVNRRVERVYAEEFLSRKYLVKAVDRLWHFQIPPAPLANATQTGAPPIRTSMTR